MAAAALPDYVTDADAVMKDDFAKWRYGRAPDYTKTRKIWSESAFLPPLVVHSYTLHSPRCAHG